MCTLVPDPSWAEMMLAPLLESLKAGSYEAYPPYKLSTWCNHIENSNEIHEIVSPNLPYCFHITYWCTALFKAPGTDANEFIVSSEAAASYVNAWEPYCSFLH